MTAAEILHDAYQREHILRRRAEALAEHARDDTVARIVAWLKGGRPSIIKVEGCVRERLRDDDDTGVAVGSISCDYANAIERREFLL